MSKTISAIRFEPQEKEWISGFAKLNGLTFSAQVRSWALERLEDEMDARDLAAAIAESDPNEPRYTTAEVAERLGIEL